MIYLLDTNTISDIIDLNAAVLNRMRSSRTNGDTLGICRPVYYELQRGLIWGNKINKLSTLSQLLPLFTWILLEDDDWLQAARFYADTRSRGYKISDIDLLIAAIAHRLAAIIVTSDNDFDALPTKRENWR